MRTAEGPLRTETTYTWASAGADAARMTMRNQGQPAGLSAALVIASAVRRANRADLARLKFPLESGTAD